MRLYHGTVVAATDHMRMYSEQIRPYLPDNRPYAPLGTDGYGRSDTREKLRSYFEVDAAHIVCPYSNATRGNINVTLNVIT